MTIKRISYRFIRVGKIHSLRRYADFVLFYPIVGGPVIESSPTTRASRLAQRLYRVESTVALIMVVEPATQ